MKFLKILLLSIISLIVISESSYAVLETQYITENMVLTRGKSYELVFNSVGNANYVMTKIYYPTMVHPTVFDSLRMTGAEAYGYQVIDSLPNGVPDASLYAFPYVFDSIGHYTMVLVFYTTFPTGYHTMMTVNVTVLPNLEDIKAKITEDYATLPEMINAFSGMGENICNFYVLDGSDSSAVDQCWLRIYNSGMTTLMAYWRTDPNGLMVSSLLDGSYKVIPFKSGYTFSGIPYSITVSGGINDTFFCEAFNPQAPADPDLCNVWGDFGDKTGTGQQNIEISITCDTRVLKAPDGRIIIDLKKEFESDSLGHWEVPLYPNSIMDPDDSKYIFVFKQGRDEWKREDVIIPDQDSWKFDW